jgi:5-methyltetrahydrofolate--homocysteine methyltransferase
VKIAPHYRNSVVHVLDASRAVGVVSSLLSDELRPGFEQKTSADYERLRLEHAARNKDNKLIPIGQARANRTPIDWAAYTPPQPQFTGARAIEAPLATRVDYIDWSPFFHTWELRGRYPAIFDDPAHGSQARELFDDARALLDRIVREDLFHARGVLAFWPANADGDDVRLFTDGTRGSPLATFHFLRQQMQKPPGQYTPALSDYIAPARPDHIGGFAVGIHGADELARIYEKENDDYSAIMAKALADRLAEAFAEYLHERARIAWGFGADEHLTREQMILEQYRGIRPAAGYPACPDHTEKATLFALLDAEARAGVRLTESFAMYPGSAVSGLYFSHPEAKYFGVGKINRDQVADYAARKGVTVEFVEKWLSPNLGY